MAGYLFLGVENVIKSLRDLDPYDEGYLLNFNYNYSIGRKVFSDAMIGFLTKMFGTGIKLHLSYFARSKNKVLSPLMYDLLRQYGYQMASTDKFININGVFLTHQQTSLKYYRLGYINTNDPLGALWDIIEQENLANWNRIYNEYYDSIYEALSPYDMNVNISNSDILKSTDKTANTSKTDITDVTDITDSETKTNTETLNTTDSTEVKNTLKDSGSSTKQTSATDNKNSNNRYAFNSVSNPVKVDEQLSSFNNNETVTPNLTHEETGTNKLTKGGTVSNEGSTTKTGKNSNTIANSGTSSKDNTYNREKTFESLIRRVGNIGNITKQDLLLKEIQLRKYKLQEQIYSDLDRYFVCQKYI
jgi:hypothetical protein